MTKRAPLTHIKNKDANYLLICSRVLRISDIMGEINPAYMKADSELSNHLNNILRYVELKEPISKDIDIEKSRDIARLNRIRIEIAILYRMLIELENDSEVKEQEIKAITSPLIS